MTHALRLPQIPRRSPLVGFIILMHAVVIYYINDGLRIWLPKPLDPMVVVTLTPEARTTQRIKPVKPQIRTNTEEVELQPLPPIDFTEEPIPVKHVEAALVNGAESGEDVPDIEVALDPRHPIGRPAYPPQAIREGQEGLVVVNACVQPDGRLANVRLARSSGYSLLDATALKHVAQPGIRMLPATMHGKPVTRCVDVPIRFDLRNR